MTKVRSKKEVIKEAPKEERDSSRGTQMDICHLKNAELERKSTNTEDELYSEVTVWKTVLALSRCISGAGFGRKSNGCCSKATRMRRTGSRFSISFGIIETSKVRMSRKLDTSNTIGQNHGPAWKTQSFPLERNLYGHPLAGLLWERQFEEVLLGLGWEKVPN